MQFLKQSTAVTIPMGPFLDSTDGNTPETILTIAQADIRLTKNGGTYAQTNNVAGATHMEYGKYGVPLNTTDTGTLGSLRADIHVAGALAVWKEFMIVPAHIYDVLVLGTDKLEVDLVQMNNDAQSLIDLKDFADAGYDPATNKIEGCKVNDDMRGTDSANTTVPDAAGVAPTAAEIKTEVEQAGSSLAQILTDTGTDGVVVAAGSKTGYTLTAAGIDAIIDEVVEGTLTLRQMLRIIKAATAGKSAGGGTTTLTFRDVADSKNRISATVDADGNRTAITVDGA